MALQGKRVLEFEGLPPLQFCGQMVADQGASVIVVKGNKNKSSAMNSFMSRGKLEVQLNLKKEKDRDFLL